MTSELEITSVMEISAIKHSLLKFWLVTAFAENKNVSLLEL